MEIHNNVNYLIGVSEATHARHDTEDVVVNGINSQARTRYWGCSES
jgi:hypothetical protein